MKKIALLLLLCVSLVLGEVSFGEKLSSAALTLTKDSVSYNASYFKIPYPNGDIPSNYGVCTDVVIRAYRKLGIDLQKLIHEDMAANFDKYPKNWALKRTDTNIDHRRVPNLAYFFSRHGKVLKISKEAKDYAPGDIVVWGLPNGSMHIGIVSNVKEGERYMIVHNIGRGQVLEDMLFSYKITAHYAYFQP
ncbi:MAG: DUF1287 domain-containing protein [Campylobacteraceae bacterium]|nr:DUF1287 domain-containing protein [Campylobacteraceae bacterium]